MPRTFSLARLLVAITLFCLFCGLAVNYPEASLPFLQLFSLFIPFAIVCLTLVSFARNRKTVLAISTVGGLVLWLLVTPPVIHMGHPALQANWDFIVRDYLSVTIYAPLGALLFGGAALADDILNRRESRNQHLNS